MFRFINIHLWLIIIVFILICCDARSGRPVFGKAAAYLDQSQIQFADREWIVKNAYCEPGVTVAPGPNYWCGDQEDIWMDQEERLHLKINYKSALGHYACASVKTPVAGCGKYTFKVTNGPNNTPDDFDKNVVLGLFTYQDASTNDNYEVDVELSDWGETQPQSNLYYVTWENDSPHSNSVLTAFGTGTITHTFEWQPSGVLFKSTKNNTLIYDAIHAPPYSYPCPTYPIYARMNLWLYNGTDPDSAQEIVIEDFVYEPLVILSAPTDLSVELSQSTAVLSWTDNSSAEGGTEIERKAESGSFSLLETVDPDETYYEDSTINPDLVYLYRIRTKSETGEYSPYSSEVQTRQEAPELDSLTSFAFLGWTGYVEGTIQNMPEGSFHVRSWVQTNKVYREGKDLSPDTNGYFYAAYGLWGTPGSTTYIWITLHNAATDIYGTGDGVTMNLEDWPDEAGDDISVFGPFPTQ